MPEPAMTVMVRVTVPLVAGRFDDELGMITPGAFRAACVATEGPDDFVPIRPVADVIVVGALPPYPRPSGADTALDAHVKVGYAESAFRVERAALVARPLAEAARHHDGSPVRVGAKPTFDGAADAFAHPAAFDYEDYQATDRDMRTTYPGPGDPIELRNLVAGPDEVVVGHVPRRAPRLLVDPSESRVGPTEVPLDLDTVTIDLDRGAVDLTYRGVLGATFQARDEIDRLIFAFATEEEWAESGLERWNDPLRRLCRGTFRHAEERADVLSGTPPPDLTEEQLVVARYESWDGPGAPETTIEVERFAAIQAELAEQRAPRHELLAKHALDDYAWNVEERAWTERLADPNEPERDALFARYDAARVEARKRHERSDEREMTVARWAHVRARIEGRDPMGALAGEGLGLGGWMRIEENMQERADADPAFAEELERELEAARARREATDPIDVEPDPEPEEPEPLVTPSPKERP
jgi:hypothetical protein